MDLFKQLGDALRPENSKAILELKANIEALDEKVFFSIGADASNYIDLQADGKEETYRIEEIYICDLQDAFYEADTPNFIKENNEWQYEPSFIKQYFLDNLQLVQTITG